MPANPTTLRSEAARIGGGVGVTLSQAADRIEALEAERAGTEAAWEAGWRAGLSEAIDAAARVCADNADGCGWLMVRSDERTTSLNLAKKIGELTFTLGGSDADR